MGTSKQKVLQIVNCFRKLNLNPSSVLMLRFIILMVVLLARQTERKIYSINLFMLK